MKRFKTVLGIAIACVLVLSTGAWAAPKFISIATGGTGGAYFPIGAGLADVINKKLTGYNAAAEVTAASKVNCINVNDGKSDIALVLGDTLSYGYKGDKLGGFAKPLTNLRVIANIYANTIQIVARKESGVTKLTDLKGKKVSVGAPGSGTEINARQIFAAAGMSYKDFGRTDYLSFSESADQMKNRAIDVTLMSSGLPNPGILDIATTQDITVVPIEGELLKVLDKETPFFVPAVIPKGTYRGQDHDVSSVGIPNFLIVRADLDDKTVYEITKAMFENLDRLVQAHAAAKGIKLENATKGLPVPLHPGAEKYYREKGLIK
ncbi:MAG: TAXI family TRAP transporter solute-binding subunit [Deltaproteobacteria bacterium]|nr:MAG: TAXI family TRAP transporter solute-binding subunit [Deltaproteobacteria bacterium]